MDIKNVIIGPIEYDVTEEDRILNSQNQDLLGQIFYERGTLKVLKDIKEDVKRTVLLHEIIHGVFDNAGMRDHDERVIDVLSHGLVMVLMDNPDVAMFLADLPVLPDGSVSTETEEDNA